MQWIIDMFSLCCCKCLALVKRESWEARVCMRSHALVKWEQELHESWWELRSESLQESFLNSHAPVKRKQELHESWEARVCMRVFSTLMPQSNENKSCMRVEKREFAWDLMPWSNENKSCMRVDESWEARVCIRVFSTLMPWSNENKSCMRVAWELRSESLHQSFLNSHALVKREQELHESWEARVCMRVFSILMPQSNENKSCMRVEKREFAWEFSQFSCPSQTRTRVAWELRSESLHESFLNSHVWPGKTRALEWMLPSHQNSTDQLKVDAGWSLGAQADNHRLLTFTNKKKATSSFYILLF
jgi:hypothetical protein